MKLPCETIRDLLPLYHDGVCSEASKQLVAEHLKTCEACAAQLLAMDAEMEMPQLNADEARPLKTIRRKNRIRIIALGLAVFLAVLAVWFELTQSASIPVKAEEYIIRNVVQFSNGMYYLEYAHPYHAISYAADIHRTEDGEIHLVEYRPRLGGKQKEEDYNVRGRVMDLDRDTIHSDTGAEVAITAFYLGCPDEGDAVLLWSSDMDIPLATPEQEQQFLFYNHISNW